MQERPVVEPAWLAWARKLQALSQTGLHFTRDPYDRLRYEDIREIATAMMAAGSDLPAERIAGLFAGEAGYATPKVDTRGVVFRDAKILLVREAEDGLWTLPGGWADVNCSPAECVVREIEEESGFRTRAVKLLGALDRARHGHQPCHAFYVYKLFFLCEIVSGEPAGSVETTEVAFFDEDEIPELSEGRVTRGQIARWFEHRRHPEWPADFD